MSLTEFIKNRKNREALRSYYTLPKKKMLAVPSLVKRIAGDTRIIGPAFDYLVRFHIKRAFPRAKTEMWVAECYVREQEEQMAVGAIRFSLVAPIKNNVQYIKKYLGVSVDNTEAKEILQSMWIHDQSIKDPEKLLMSMRLAIEDAKDNYFNYIKNGVLKPALIRSAVILARIDSCYRSGLVYFPTVKVLTTVSDSYVKELIRLLELLPEDVFIPKQRCLLNPTFGDASIAIGGADCDIIIDDKLIDLKVHADSEIKQNMWDQLFGYYALYKIHQKKCFGVKYRGTKPIYKLGIYNARYGDYVEVDVRKQNREKMKKLISFFEKKLRIRY